MADSGQRNKTRGKRWLHRRGVVFRGIVQPTDGSAQLRPALVRLSTTFGWPRPLPDFIGMAVRLFDGNGSGDEHHLDLLLASSRPGRDVLDCKLTSIVPCLVDGDQQVVRATPSEARSADLDALSNGEDPCPIGYHLDGIGELLLTERLHDDVTIRFTPPATGPRLIAPLRSAIYARAQRRQPAEPAESGLEQVATTSGAH